MSSTPSGEGLSNLRQALHDRQTARTRNSCLPCRERKVRCNREQPCLTCVKRDHPDLCIYSLSSPAAKAPGHAARRAVFQPARREGEPPNLTSTSPPDLRPTPQVDGPSPPIVSLPQGSSLMRGGSLLAIAREHSPQPREDDATRRDVLENAVIPLLGMQVPSVDEAGLENGQNESITGDDPYADLPGDQDLLKLFSVYRNRVHPFQLIIDDLEAVEGELCAIIGQRAGTRSSSAEESRPPRHVSTDRRRFLCLLHAILATGAHFSEMSASDRSIVSQRQSE